MSTWDSWGQTTNKTKSTTNCLCVWWLYPFSSKTTPKKKQCSKKASSRILRSSRNGTTSSRNDSCVPPTLSNPSIIILWVSYLIACDYMQSLFKYVSRDRPRQRSRPEFQHLLGPAWNRLQILLSTWNCAHSTLLLHLEHDTLPAQHHQLYSWQISTVEAAHVLHAARDRQFRNHQRPLRLLSALHVHAWCGKTVITQ